MKAGRAPGFRSNKKFKSHGNENLEISKPLKKAPPTLPHTTMHTLHMIKL